MLQVQRPPNAPDAFRRAVEELVTAWFAAAAGMLLDPVQVRPRGLLSVTVAPLQLLRAVGAELWAADFWSLAKLHALFTLLLTASAHAISVMVFRGTTLAASASPQWAAGRHRLAPVQRHC